MSTLKRWSSKDPVKGSLSAALILHATVLFGGGLGLVTQAEYGLSATSGGSPAAYRPRPAEDLRDLDELLADEDAPAERIVKVKPTPVAVPQPPVPQPVAAAMPSNLPSGPANSLGGPGPVVPGAPAGAGGNGGSLEVPTFYRNPIPNYPAEARRQKLQGLVQLRVNVSSTGSVQGVQLLQSSGHEILDQAAVNAVKTWRFKPARLAGFPVATDVDVPINFKLRG